MGKTAAPSGKHGRSILEKKKCPEVRYEGVQRGFLSERKGKANPCRGAEDRKSAGTNSGNSGTTPTE